MKLLVQFDDRLLRPITERKKTGQSFMMSWFPFDRHSTGLNSVTELIFRLLLKITVGLVIYKCAVSIICPSVTISLVVAPFSFLCVSFIELVEEREMIAIVSSHLRLLQGPE